MFPWLCGIRATETLVVRRPEWSLVESVTCAFLVLSWLNGIRTTEVPKSGWKVDRTARIKFSWICGKKWGGGHFGIDQCFLSPAFLVLRSLVLSGQQMCEEGVEKCICTIFRHRQISPHTSARLVPTSLTWFIQGSKSAKRWWKNLTCRDFYPTFVVTEMESRRQSFSGSIQFRRAICFKYLEHHVRIY